MNQEMVNYIRQRAQARGIDPDIAVRVASGEGGLNNPFRHGEAAAPRGQAPGLGATENSYGPFQLWVSGNGGGLGDKALAAGIDPRTNWRGGVDFALNNAATDGWGAWYGAKKAGITGMRGITQGGQPLAYDMSGDTQRTVGAGGQLPAVPGMTLGSGPVGQSIGPQSAVDSSGNPGGYVAPMPPATNIPDPGTPAMIADGSKPITPPPNQVPDPSVPATVPGVSLGTQVAGDLKSGNITGALGALGGNKDLMGSLGGLANTMGGGGGQQQGQKQQNATMQAPNLDTNAPAIAAAAPQLMANLMRNKRIPGMSIGGMPSGMGY